jgi:prepilin signal peptidase PulO-like enzyme (type II secretory pathway)
VERWDVDLFVDQLDLAAPVFVLGVLFGSFANVLAYRIPLRQSIVHPASRCPNCGHTLSMKDLIPIASWVVQLGKCRYCQLPISVTYPVIELGMGCAWMVSWLTSQNLASALTSFLFWFVLLTITGSDLRYRLVPNALSYTSFLLLVVCVPLSGAHPITFSLLGAILGFASVYVIHIGTRRRGIGLGDAKLYLCIGSVLGPWLALLSFVIAAFAGSIVGIVLTLLGRLSRKEPIPFVPFIAIGVAVSMFFGSEFLTWYRGYFL